MVNEMRSIPRRSVRVYYEVSKDLKTIYIIGLTRNYMIQLNSTFRYRAVGENEFETRPICAVPFIYYTSLPKKDVDFAISQAEDILINDLASTSQTSENITIRSILFDSIEYLPGYSREKILSVLRGNNISEEQPKYYMPVDSCTILNADQVNKYTVCRNDFNDRTTRDIDGIELSIDCKVTKGKYSLNQLEGVSKIQISTQFIGVRFIRCYYYPFEVNTTLWMRWDDFFHNYNDPVFEQAIECKLNEYLYKELISPYVEEIRY